MCCFWVCFPAEFLLRVTWFLVFSSSVEDPLGLNLKSAETSARIWLSLFKRSRISFASGGVFALGSFFASPAVAFGVVGVSGIFVGVAGILIGELESFAEEFVSVSVELIDMCESALFRGQVRTLWPFRPQWLHLRGMLGVSTSKLMNLWPQRRLSSSANFSLTASLASVRRSSQATLGVTSIPVVPASVQRWDAPGVLDSVHACSFVFASCIVVQSLCQITCFLQYRHKC